MKPNLKIGLIEDIMLTMLKRFGLCCLLLYGIYKMMMLMREGI